jgi:hypothetical protein
MDQAITLMLAGVNECVAIFPVDLHQRNTGMTGLLICTVSLMVLPGRQKALAFVRTVAENVPLTDVEALNINGLRAGNIILELVLRRKV